MATAADHDATRQASRTMELHEGSEAAWFVDRFGDEAGEALWAAALALLEQALAAGREGHWSRWRYYPAGELRRLRRDVARSLRLAHQAVLIQELINAELRELNRPVDELLLERAREERRRGTVEAERVRLIKQRARREGREASRDELHGDA